MFMRWVLGTLSAQAAAGYGDPDPSCGARRAAIIVAEGVDANGNATPSLNAASNYQASATACLPQATTTALGVVSGSAAVGIGGVGFLFGPEAVANAGALVSCDLSYVTSMLGYGMILVGGAVNQGTAYGQQLVQGGRKY